MKQILNWYTAMYPLWITLSSLVGLSRPETLDWFTGPWVVWALVAVMLSMGSTLNIGDFRRLALMPSAVALGFGLQYTVMPLTGFCAGWLLDLDTGLMIGLILVASCPGGTASNLITYLARGNVALSVVMTMASTLLAFIMTPLWCRLLAGKFVPVNAWALCLSTLQVVVLPVLIGVVLNWRFPRQVAKSARFAPAISVTAIILIAGGIMAQNAASVLEHAGRVALAVLMLHAVGFIVGYVIARQLGYSVVVSRTISIEVGMQNGGMAAVLAKQHFTSLALAGVPAVFSSVIQNLAGSLLAAFWRRRLPPEDRETAPVATEERR